MDEFMKLISQIFIIAVIQIVIESFINISEKPYQSKIINIACFLGSLYILLKFIFDFLLKDINNILKIGFFK